MAAEVPWIQGRVDHWILIVPFASSFYQGQVPDLIVIPVPVKVKLLSRVRLFVTPWTVAYQAPLSMGFSRQEYWSELHFLLQRIFPTQGLNPSLLHCRQTLYLTVIKEMHNKASVIYHLMHAKLLQSCLTLCSTRLLCSWNSPGKDTGVG